MMGPLEREPVAGFEPVEHTADVGLRIWAPTREGLFERAAAGMASLLVDPASVEPVEEREVAVGAADVEEALVSWLQEILYLYEVQRFVPARFRLERADAGGVHGWVVGERFDPSRHETRADIKAVTYHDLRIERSETEDGRERWRTTVIFDI
ncbi:MAG: archease [Candidatus Eisenbacteria bacterium]|nr:archease [Candidatus Latescibacterota bacterium]MBD3301232.1 archease [Candidatus Eisenbacteria bacterium]